MSRGLRVLRSAHRWWRLPRAERAFTAHVAVLLPLCEALLVRVRPDALVARRVHIAGARRLAPARAAALIEAVAARHPMSPHCLAQALVGHWALHAIGIPTEVVIGCVRTAPFEAHAWLRGAGITWVGGATALVCREIHAFARGTAA